MLVTETTGIKLLPKIIVLNPKDGALLPGNFKKFLLHFQKNMVY